MMFHTLHYFSNVLYVEIIDCFEDVVEPTTSECWLATSLYACLIEATVS